MNTNVLRKSLIVGVIFLLIGIAIAPSINFSVVKASDDNDLVEVTTEACGIKGFGNQTVKLTKQQYQNLEQYLVEFRARLNQTTTREEAVPIFKEAVVELNKYGLLPAGMSVERAQKLVVGQNQENIKKLQEKLLHEHVFTLDNDSNYFCLIAGNTNWATQFQGPMSTATSYMLFFLSKLGIDLYFLVIVMTWLNFFSNFFPLPPMNCIGFGTHPTPYVHHSTPAIGWIQTFGLVGVRKWNGSFYGGLSPSPYIIFYWTEFYLGCRGFTGIRIGLEFSSWFYFGSALEICIS